MEVSGGDAHPPSYPSGLREGPEVTGGDGPGPGVGRSWRTATVRRE